MVDENLIFCTCNLYLIVIRCVTFTIHNDTVHIQPDQGQMHCYTSVIHEAKWLLNQVPSCITRSCRKIVAAMVANERTISVVFRRYPEVVHGDTAKIYVDPR